MIVDIFNGGMSLNSITEKANGVNNSIGLGLASLFANGHFLSTIKLFLGAEGSTFSLLRPN